jgi:catechol 2,3-dioxygenase-like lactoylglutathione lyase family enzyme
MTHSFIEHVNVTVSDPKITAEFLCDIFGWKVRWHGDAIDNGITYHVGSDTHYIAVYSKGSPAVSDKASYDKLGGLNHIGIVVDNLDEIEEKILAKGYETFSHGNYEPGRRFYFRDSDNIEFEIVSYV